MLSILPSRAACLQHHTQKYKAHSMQIQTVACCVGGERAIVHLEHAEHSASESCLSATAAAHLPGSAVAAHILLATQSVSRSHVH